MPSYFECKGDDAKLKQLVARFTRIASDLSPRLKVDERDALDTSLDATFATGTDPSGKPWPASKGGGAPLAGLRSKVVAQESGEGVLLTARPPVAAHQRGAVIRPTRARILRFVPRGGGKPIFTKQVTLPKRAVLPEHGDRLGPSWSSPMRKAALAALTKFLKG